MNKRQYKKHKRKCWYKKYSNLRFHLFIMEVDETMIEYNVSSSDHLRCIPRYDFDKRTSKSYCLLYECKDDNVGWLVHTVINDRDTANEKYLDAIIEVNIKGCKIINSQIDFVYRI